MTGGSGPPEREVRLCEPRKPWYYFPLKSIIDTHQALLKGHVLLGFLKDGIHLISYLCQVIIHILKYIVYHLCVEFVICSFLKVSGIMTPRSMILIYSLDERINNF